VATFQRVSGGSGSSAALTALTATAVRRLIHNGSAYPARPSDLPAGCAEYVGPTQPTTWLDGDTWIEITP
jgi:hypothetical protein